MSIFFSIIFSFSYLMLPTQKPTEAMEGIAKVQLIQLDHTGKRHESYLFTFKVLEILEGSSPDSVLTSQEIFRDFGGKQLIAKIYDNNGLIGEGLGEPILIKFTPPIIGEEHIPKPNCFVKWGAELNRKYSFEKLVHLLEKKYASNSHVPINEILLKEMYGAAYFSDGKATKVVVESPYGSGRWVIATVDADN